MDSDDFFLEIKKKIAAGATASAAAGSDAARKRYRRWEKKRADSAPCVEGVEEVFDLEELERRLLLKVFEGVEKNSREDKKIALEILKAKNQKYKQAQGSFSPNEFQAVWKKIINGGEK